MTSAPKENPKNEIKVNQEKWSPLLIEYGWTTIPNIIIEKQAALGLDALDMNLILHLAHYWWRAENLPHPSVKTIATALQVSSRTIQKRIARLENTGFIKRIPRRKSDKSNETNQYDFKGLITLATPYAKEALAEQIQAQTAKKARLARKKPVS